MKAKLLKIWLITLISSLSLYSFSADRYWVGGSGVWTDASHWSTVSGGNGGALVPTLNDNVFIDSKSFTATGQSITIAGNVFCNNLNWSNTNLNPELIGKSTTTITVNGSYSITDSFVDSYAGTIIFAGSDKNAISLSQKINANILFNGTGSWTLLTDLNTAKNITLQSGSFETNNKDVFAYTFDGNGSQSRSFILGSSKVTVTRWLFGSTQNLKFDGTKSTIIVLGNWDTDLQQGNLFYNLLTNSLKRALTVDSIAVTPYKCDKTGKTKGKVTVYVSGVSFNANYKLFDNSASIPLIQAKNTQPLTYSFDSLILDPSYSGHSYSVTVSKTGNPDVVKSIVYPSTWPSQMSVSLAVVKDVTCALTSCDAQLSANPTGGVAPYSYKWNISPQQTTKIATGLCNNNYSCDVTDANSCTVSGANFYYPGQPGYTGPRPFVFINDPVTNTASCGSQNNGTIAIKMTGGLGPRQFKLVSSNGLDNRAYQLDSNFSNLHTGYIYAIWAKDSIGCEKKAANDVTIGAILEPVVNASVDTTICADLTVNLGATVASNCSKIAWVTSGDGTFSSTSIRNPIYTPGVNDKLSGTVTLTINGTGLAGCNNVTDSRIVTISPLPTVFAGSDQTVCLSSFTFPLSGATASNYSTITWTKSGDGIFSNAAILNPNYTFGTNDTIAKSARLFLAIKGTNGCLTRIVKDSLDFTMIDTARTFAGTDLNMCKGNTYTASTATAHSYTVLVWTTNGSGSFSSSSILKPIYTPSPADKTAGSVILTLKATAVAPCVDYQSTVKLSFFDPPTVSAGSDYKVCSNGDFTLTEPNQTFCSALKWTSSGDGTFNNSTILKPVYTPGKNDTASGVVSLILTGTGTGGCLSSTVVDTMVLTMIDSAYALAGPNQDLCKGSSFTISNAKAKNYTSVLWSTSGTAGTLSSTNTLVTTYNPSAADKAAGFVNLTLTAKGINPCPDVPSVLKVTLFDQPTIEAGNDSSVCTWKSYDLKATTAASYSAIQWSTAGDGTFNDKTLLKPIYTPGTTDTLNNSVLLKVTATGTGGCIAMQVKDSVKVSLIDSSFASAGVDHDVCKGSSLSISDASAKNYSSLLWTSTGTGSFSAPTAKITTYTPSAGDLTLSLVKLTLTAKGNSPCPDYPSQITVNLHDQPTVFAGNDTTVCSKSSYTLSTSSVSNNNTLTWSAPGGDGSFNSAVALHPIYTPGATDKTKGLVLLKLAVTGKLACSAISKADSMVLTMNDPASVEAGADMDVCKNKPIVIIDASATNYASLKWITSGTGSFSDNKVIAPAYIPSVADKAAGNVKLTLNVTALSSCSDLTDFKTVNLYDAVTANSGGDTIICYNSNYVFVNDDATHSKTLQWQVVGDGLLSSTTTLHPTYTLGANDISGGFALLTLKATGFANCDPVSSSMTLSVDKGPQIDAGTDVEICYNGKASITASTGTPSTYSALLWTTSGDGTFNDASLLHPVYTPGPADLASKTVKLTLTATGKSACKTAVDFMNVSILNQLNVSITSGGPHPNSTSCFGYWDADAHILASGGNSPYKYNWSDAKVTGKDTLLYKGTFIASVTDNKGCVVTNSIVITEPIKISTSFVKTNNKCFGDALGSSTVTPSNGVLPYSYKWSSGSTLANATLLTAGKKYVTITDGNTCKIVDSVIITEPTKIKPNLLLTLPGCPGDGNGSITTNPSGGTLVSPDYSYLWSNANTTNSISGLSKGSFGLTITDDNLCTFNTTIVLPDPKPLAVNFEVSDVKCYGDSTGQIIAHVTGGTSPYSFAWTDMNGTLDSIIKNTPITTLQVDIYDDNMCELFSNPVTVNQPAKFSVGVGKPSSFLIQASTKISVKFKGKSDLIQDIGFNLIAPNGTVVTLTSSPSSTGTPNPPCNFGRNFELNYTTEAASSLNECNIHPFLSGWPVAWTDNDRVGWPENPAIKGDFKPETPWNVIYGQDPSNGGWALEIVDCSPVRINEKADSNVWKNASLSFTDINAKTGLEETILFQQTNLNSYINQPVSGCASSKYKIPLKMSTSCFGVCDAQGIMFPDGGKSPYTYKWSDPTIPSKDTLMLCAGIYTLTAIDANGCTAKGGAEIIQPGKIKANLDSVNNLCFGKATGKAWSVVKSGGTRPFTYLWNNGATDSVTKNIVAGKYFLTITDDGGCHQKDSIVVKDSLKVLSIITMDSTLCEKSADGAIHLAPYGTNIQSPFSYKWQTGGTNASLTNIVSGTYTVTVLDKQGCELDTSAKVLSPSALAFGSVVVKSTTCKGRNDGGITLVVSGGTKSYKYHWRNLAWSVDSTRDKLESITSGTYNLTVTDHYGCSKDTSFIVTDPATMVSKVLNTDSVKCFGDASGTASVSILSGGAIPYSYKWSTGATIDNVSGLTSGIYFVTVSDKFACKIKDSAIIKQPNVLNLKTTVIDSVSCHGTATAKFKVSTLGGSKPYSFIWNNAVTDSIVSNVKAGTYTVTVADANNCADKISIVVADRSLLIATITVDSTKCTTSSDGAIYVSPNESNKKKPFTYLWQTSGTDSSLKNIISGKYTVTVHDKYGCELDTFATVKSPLPLSFSGVIISPTTCKGRSDASISLIVTGGTKSYVYKWKNATWSTDSTRDKLESIPAGKYDLHLTDHYGCSKDTSFTLTDPAVMVSTLIATDSVKCFGNATGTASVSVVNGTTPYTYKWSNGAILDNISALKAGKYVVTVYDKYACSVKDSATIKEPNLLSISTSIIDSVTCNGSSTSKFKVSTIGGTKPYSFKWTNAAIDSVVSSEKAGNYTVTVTDAKNCSDKATVLITEPTKLIVSSIGQESSQCSTPTGKAYVGVSGGTVPYTYLWSNGGTLDTIKNVLAGKYSMTITDKKGCVIDSSITIKDTTTLIVKTHAIQKSVTCKGRNDGSGYVVVTGGKLPYSIVWSNASVADTLTKLIANTYTVSVTDGNTCLRTDNLVIDESNILAAVFDSIHNVSCYSTNNGLLRVKASGGDAINGYSYKWSNASTATKISALTTGKYSVTVTDKTNCIVSVSDSLVGEVLTATFVNTKDILCDGTCTGSSIFSPDKAIGKAPFVFNWGNGETDSSAKALCVGPTSVTVTDKNGCSYNDKVVIGDFVDPLSVKFDTSYTACGQAKAKAVAHVIGGVKNYSFKWSDLDNVSNTKTDSSLTLIPVGNYNLTATDANGCKIVSMVEIADTSHLPFDTKIVNVWCVPCSGKMIVYDTLATDVATYSYKWSAGKNSASGLQKDTLFNACLGMQDVKVTRQDGCINVFRDTVKRDKGLDIVMHVISPRTCIYANDAAAYVSYKDNVNPVTFKWSNGSKDSSAVNLASGTYKVTVSDGVCTIVDSIVFVDPIAPDVTMSSTTVSCFGGSDGSATMTMKNALVPDSVIWNSVPAKKGLIASSLPMGTYTATLYYNGKCQYTNSVKVNQNTLLTTVNTVTNATCNHNDGKIVVTPSGGLPPYTYLWKIVGMKDSVLVGGTTNTLSNIGVDFYSIEVKDSMKCTVIKNEKVSDNGGITIAVDSVRYPTCPGVNNGYIRIKTNPNPPFKYSFWKYDDKWLTGADTASTATTGMALNLAVGDYKVYVSNGKSTNCKEVYPFKMTPYYLAASIKKQDLTCPLQPDGWAKVTASQGFPFLHKPNYRYKWSTGSTKDSIFGLIAGTYTVTVTDSIDCAVAINSVVIANPVFMTVSLPSDTILTTCYGTAAGDITPLVTGGQIPYSYIWDKVPSSASLSGAKVGWHYVTVTDKGCFTANDSIYVDKKGYLKWAQPHDTLRTLCGKSIGQITVHVGASAKPVKYLWNTGATDSIIKNLLVDYYSVTAIDANNCIISDTIKVEDISTVDFKINKVSDVHCLGKAIGRAFISDTIGGTIPYTIMSWVNESFELDTLFGRKADSLKAGVIEVRVNDKNSCTGLKRLNVLTDSVLQLSFSNVIQDVSCPIAPTHTGQAQVDVAFGKPTYTYSWSNTPTNTKIISGLAPGKYFITVTDQYSCKVSDSIVINKAPLVVDLVKLTDALCNGTSDGTIQVAPKNGLGKTVTYAWSNGQALATATGLAIGDYTVTITESTNACVAVDTFTINQPKPFSVTYQTLKRTSCKDSTGIVTAHLLGGTKPYSFVWTEFVKTDTVSNDSTFINYWADYFKMFVTDANACKFADTTRTTDTSLLSLNLVKITPVSCYGKSDGSVSVVAKDGFGAYKYTWLYDGTITIPALSAVKAGAYTVTVTDDSLCWRDYTADIKQPDTLKIAFPYPSVITCNGKGDTLVASILGGNGSNVLTWKKDNVAISTTDTIIPDATIGTFHVSVIDSKSCKADSSIIITQAKPIVLIDTVLNAGCGTQLATGAITVKKITSDYMPVTFKWFDNTTDSTINSLPAGLYDIVITDAQKCSVTKTIEVFTENFAWLHVDTVLMSKCNYNSPTGIVVAKAMGSVEPYKWAWSRSVNDITDTIKKVAAGKYYVTVTGANGCTMSDSVTVKAMINLDAEITTKNSNGAVDSIHFCKNDSTTLIGVNTKRILHFPVGYKVPAKNERFLWGVKDGNTDELQATMSSTLGDTIKVKPFQATTYQMWYSLYGCNVPVRQVSLSYYSPIGLKIDIDKDGTILHDTTSIIKGYKLQLKPKDEPWFIAKDSSKFGFVSYEWLSFDSLMKRDGIVNGDPLIDEKYYTAYNTYSLEVDPAKTSWYVVIGKTNYGCYERDSVRITVIPEFTIPSGISPNGDGVNDKWNLPYLKQFPEVRVTVFNRWGIVVWEKTKDYTTDPFVGKNKDGKDLPLGTYYYLIEFNDDKGTKPKAGSITIVR